MKTAVARLILAAGSVLGAAAVFASPPASLFDGRSLAGWDCDSKWWRVEDGEIVGGSLAEKPPQAVYLVTARSYENFDLTLKMRIVGGEGVPNSGVRIRSARIPGGTEMSGYEVDAGEGWWGYLFDKRRPNKYTAKSADLTALNAGIKKDDWNDLRVRADGPRIQAWINGALMFDFTEIQPDVPADGHVGIQVHGNVKMLVRLRDLRIEELPPTPGAFTWTQFGPAKADVAPKRGAKGSGH